ncbi:hypothetical protein C2R22_13700 [Salinigranum rubrum]|uniref:Uncharacterized protein n=1 Tax=Salinigranum rubrum TaxID=755307 RepID=A0A2I8VKV1_9EURY|nr:hypothetical protein [Salinigranum rubrum]AUV82562.1 hypothetical protein C2R22_13700 [Salinigranum rubrum]
MAVRLDWFVDFEPPWLPPALLVLGSVVLVYGLLSVDERYRDGSVLRRLMIAVGIGLVYLPFHLRFQLASVVLLSLAGKFLEGVAVVRSYQKLHYIAKRRSLPGRVSLQAKAFFMLSGLFVLFVSGWLFVGLILAETPGSLSTTVIITWTVATAATAVIGMSSKLWAVKGRTSTAIIVGFSVMVAGAEIHNLAMLAQELTLYLVNTAFFAVGFVVASYLVLTRGREVAALSQQLSERSGDRA